MDDRPQDGLVLRPGDDDRQRATSDLEEQIEERVIAALAKTKLNYLLL